MHLHALPARWNLERLAAGLHAKQTRPRGARFRRLKSEPPLIAVHAAYSYCTPVRHGKSDPASLVSREITTRRLLLPFTERAFPFLSSHTSYHSLIFLFRHHLIPKAPSILDRQWLTHHLPPPTPHRFILKLAAAASSPHAG